MITRLLPFFLGWAMAAAGAATPDDGNRILSFQAEKPQTWFQADPALYTLEAVPPGDPIAEGEPVVKVTVLQPLTRPGHLPFPGLLFVDPEKTYLLSLEVLIPEDPVEIRPGGYAHTAHGQVGGVNITLHRTDTGETRGGALGPIPSWTRMETVISPPDHRLPKDVFRVSFGIWVQNETAPATFYLRHIRLEEAAP